MVALRQSFDVALTHKLQTQSEGPKQVAKKPSMDTPRRSFAFVAKDQNGDYHYQEVEPERNRIQVARRIIQ